jgi:hypothetical protein
LVHGGVREPGSGLQQLGETEVVGLPENLRARVIGEDDRQQGQAEPGRRDQHVLPRGLRGAVGVLDGDEQRGDDSGHLDGYPQQGQIAHQRSRQHGPAEHVQADPEPPGVTRSLVAVIAKVAHGVDSNRGIQESRGQQEHRAQRIGPEESQILQIAMRRLRQQCDDEPEAAGA